MKKTTLIALMLGCGSILGAAAQTPPPAPTPMPTEFPPDATALTAAELKERLADKVFSVQLANGGSWRLDYRANGHFFVNVGGGGNASGPWRTEDGKLCSQVRGSDAACNEVRQRGELLYLKRTSGEVVTMIPK